MILPPVFHIQRGRRDSRSVYNMPSGPGHAAYRTPGMQILRGLNSCFSIKSAGTGRTGRDSRGWTGLDEMERMEQDGLDGTGRDRAGQDGMDGTGQDRTDVPP